MEQRRQFLKKLFGFMAGVGVFLNPFYSALQSAWAKAERIVLPKGTRRETLIDKNPADLDPSNLEIMSLDQFGKHGSE